MDFIDNPDDAAQAPPEAENRGIPYRLRYELESRGIDVAEAIRNLIQGELTIPETIRNALAALSNSSLMALIISNKVTPLTYFIIRGLVRLLEKLGGNAAVDYLADPSAKPEEAEKKKKENIKINKETTDTIDENAPVFPGFLDGHVLFIGSTGSGKTTALKQFLAYGLIQNGKPLFERVKKCFFINNSSTTKGEIEEVRMACAALEGSYDLEGKNWAESIEFHFFNFGEIDSAFAEIEKDSDRKIIIIDDFQSRKEVSQVVSEKLRFIRKFGAQMILLAHSYQNEKGIVAIRKSVRYIVVCGETAPSFRAILANTYTEKDKNELTQKYLDLGSFGARETSIYRKKVIIDVQTGRMYYGTPRFLEFNSKFNHQVDNNLTQPDDEAKRPKFF